MGRGHNSGPGTARHGGRFLWGTVLAAGLTAVVMVLAIHAHDAASPAGGACAKAGVWLDPATGAIIPADRMTASLAARPVVLLGEAHTDAEQHRWQLYTLAALHGRKPDMVIGFESFPRRLQPVLDRWVNGELDPKAFLEAVDWPEVWGYDAALYMPLFDFARQNRVPMVALNVDSDFVDRVREKGWAAIPKDEREGLSDPAPASEAYRKSLAEIYLFEKSHMAGGTEGDPHAAEGGGQGDPAAAPGEASPPVEAAAPAGEADIAAVLETEDFQRFVDAQLTWDRAMAEALAAARRQRPEALVVGIMGRGHIEHRYGVPHQLADLGIADAAVLLPVERDSGCDDLSADLADAVFVVDSVGRLVAAAPKARLGVLVRTTDDGVRVESVMDDSVAAATGIAKGDIIVSAAGFPVAEVGELIEIVQRQAPGTWLPLVIRRDGAETDLVAKFPTEFEPPK